MTAGSATPILDIRGLRKRFGRVDVLRGVDLAFAPGRITAVVGPNAAGKSTLLKCVLGLVRPDGGEIRYEGTTVRDRHDYRAGVGFMPQRAAFPENLTGWEVLRLVRSLRPGALDTDEDLVHRLGLAPELRKPVRALSGGTRQKLNAVVALLFRPRLLILDEPTAGLDPLGSGILKEKVVDVAARGATVILTSHLMGEIEELADRVVFMVEGRIHFEGTMAGLHHLTGEQRLERAVARLMRARVA